MSASASRIELVLLGTFEARIDGRPVSGLLYNKMRALLAYLVVERGKEHGRGALASLLWLDTDSAIARGNLRRTLADLRRVLELPSGKTLFIASKHTIRFNPEADIDLIEFVETKPQGDERILDLYRGEFMAGLSLPDCTDFEEWLQMQRESLNRRAVSLLERSASHHEASGNLDKALQFSMRHAEFDPWDEETHARIMRLHALKGEKSSAFRHYLSYCKMMERELGLPPGKAVSALAMRIRSGDLSPETPDPSRRSGAERRRVTVLHCELSAAESEDPEEAMALLQESQSNAIGILHEFSGHVVQSHGGTLLAYFGYPEAHEHAALRAVEAALSVTNQVSPGMVIRAGIHTGFIVTDRDSPVPDVIGKTSGLAIQLRRLAGSGETVVSSDTHHLINGYFLCENLGEMPMYGTSRRLEAFRVLKKNDARSRLEATDRLTPLVGRDAEIGTLLRLWDRSRQGAGHLVLVTGEAGMGKSRLVHTLKELLAKEGITIRELRCFPESAHSPFHPLIAMLESLYGFEQDDSAEIKYEKLGLRFEKLYPNADRNILLLLARLLSIPVDEPVGLSPQENREKLALAILDLLQHLASRQPVLYIIEDLHWIDPSTLELIERFAEKAEKRSILMVLTSRMEFDTSLKEKNVLKMELPPLSNPEMANLVRLIDKDIPEETLGQIVKRADGIPLYAEEMAKMTFGSPGAIPPTLHDLLAVKLDALGEAKLVAQLAATIGREFDIDLLRAIVPSSSDLGSHLSVLQDAGLISKGPKYHFKHALIADAAYQSQARADRESAHRKIAGALQNTDVAKTQPEVLAQHFTSAGEKVSAIECWIEAGRRAAMHSANAEAVAHFRAGLELVEFLPVGDMHRGRLEFTLQAALGVALQATQGYGSIEATRANERASALSCMIGHCHELFLAQWTQVMNILASRGSIEVLGKATRLFDVVDGDPVRMQAAHYAVADAAFWSGDFITSKIHTQQAIALYQPNHHPVQVEQFNEDLSVSCMAYLAWSSHFLGEQEEALQICKRMLDGARKFAHPHTLALALCFASVLHRWQDMPAETLELSRETIAVSRRHDFPVWLAAGEMAHGWAQVMLEKKEDGIAEIESSIAGMRAAIGGISVVFLSALIEAHVHLGRYGKALELIGEALIDASKTGDGHYTAELYRLKGECLLGIPGANRVEVQGCFDQALATSRLQAARTLELRAAMSLARHFGD